MFFKKKNLPSRSEVKEFYSILFALLFKGLKIGVIDKTKLDAIVSFCLEVNNEKK